RVVVFFFFQAEDGIRDFHVTGVQTCALPIFGIANIESRDEAEVRKGYERVIRPRFSDAKFFFDEDLKQGLLAMGEGLKTVTYQEIGRASCREGGESSVGAGAG